MLFCSKVAAKNLPWIEVSINHVYNDKFEKQLNEFKVKHPSNMHSRFNVD